MSPDTPLPTPGETGRSRGGMRPRRHKVMLDDGPASWLETEQGGGVPLVLLHGLGGDALTWQFNVTAFAGGERKVLALDLPGHGTSTLDVGGARVCDLADWVENLLDQRGLGRVDLVGHSLGARVALDLAHRPGRVRRASLLACAGLGSDLDYGFLDRLAGAADITQARAVAAALFAQPDQLVEPLARALALRMADAAARQAVAAILAANRADLGEKLVARDWAPPGVALQLIWGAEDRIVPPPAAELIPTRIPLHLLQGAGHMPHVEAASRVNELVRSFHA
ncbi:alpha/beta fold hydrolase [Niveispirillum sp. BGYR6]|uniref:alpha/beta fold hydrolase n=1 Tax=Niveispirillum sp. BGYR6 TaxID=2971249 RepID=UPI0022B9856E|nr:alpha/beta fold hydrolase [Niveispirillum sp. BGYR6]